MSGLRTLAEAEQYESEIRKREQDAIMKKNRQRLVLFK